MSPYLSWRRNHEAMRRILVRDAREYRAVVRRTRPRKRWPLIEWLIEILKPLHAAITQ